MAVSLFKISALSVTNVYANYSEYKYAYSV